MDPFKARAKHGQEFFIQNKFVEYLEGRGWLVERLVGNAFQRGIPDVYIAHPDHGQRWVDFKVHGSYEYTKPQQEKWPIWEKFGVGIWILGARSAKECTKEQMDSEYKLLFGPPNMRDFWKSKYDTKIDVDGLLEKLNANSKSRDEW